MGLLYQLDLGLLAHDSGGDVASSYSPSLALCRLPKSKVLLGPVPLSKSSSTQASRAKLRCSLQLAAARQMALSAGARAEQACAKVESCSKEYLDFVWLFSRNGADDGS